MSIGIPRGRPRGLFLALALSSILAARALPAAEGVRPSGPVTAEERRFWSFQPPADAAAPGVKDESWPQSDIDRFVLARLEAAGLRPSRPAEKRVLLRRATFDLLGLPPEPAEIAEFLSDDSPAAFAKVVDRLLESPHYGERMGRLWLDVVRYADTAGETADYPVPEAYRYRNYVIDSFNRDKPYDDFIREQVAGDLLAEEGPRRDYAERVTATGYLAISRRFGFDSELYHHLTIQDTIDNVGQTFLGLSLGCARCHDHKYDPLTMADYYALYGIFESTRYAFPGSEQKQRTQALVPLLPPGEAEPLCEAAAAEQRDLARELASLKVKHASAKLISLQGIDGDFELQAPASGGSQGILVPPWEYTGGPSITASAQSPFTHLYPPGSCGLSLPEGSGEDAVEQAVWRAGEGKRLQFAVDFRTGGDERAPGTWRLCLGDSRGKAVVEVFVGARALFVQSGEAVELIRTLERGAWHHLQIVADFEKRRFWGRAGPPGDVAELPARDFAGSVGGVGGASGAIERLRIDGRGHLSGARPALDLDNLALRERELPLLPPREADAGERSRTPESIQAELRQLVGLEGDFESQPLGGPPVFPWHPGPQSVVKISPSGQSPFRHVYGRGTRGLSFPGGAAYNGFGQTLERARTASDTERLHYSIDFRLDDAAVGSEGSYRFYLGHGPGSSAALEAFAGKQAFWVKTADAVERVRDLAPGAWYSVQVLLDLKTKTFSGSISGTGEATLFTGKPCPAGWDGAVDYTFVDTYGHLTGPRPALFVDNLALQTDAPTPAPPSAPALADAAGSGDDADPSRAAKAGEIRAELSRLEARGPEALRRLAALADGGPCDLAYAVAEGTPRDARIQKRGEPASRSEIVPRRFLEVLGGDRLPAACKGSGRRELAEWLVRPSNPLTARVLVNRIWQHHFGKGLVATGNDFGRRGERPTHPELLDYLARRFMESGWSIKRLQRSILLSSVYQLASADDTRSAAADPENKLLWRQSRRRLDAESIRDAMLAVSGRLDRTPGGRHPFPAAGQRAYTQHSPFTASYETNRRSIYLMTQRIKHHPFLSLFDGADPNSSTPRRRETTTPTQALFLMNDPFVHEQAAAFAGRLLKDAEEPAGRIVAAIEAAFGREPAPAEVDESLEFLEAYRGRLSAAGVAGGELEAQAWAAYARTLLARNEFFFLD